MKATLICLSALLISGACLAEECELPHVSVFGTAVKEVEPDLLRWRISISGIGADVETVAEQHATQVSAALSFLKDKEIPAEKIQTSRMQLAEHREYRNDSWIKEGYQASTVISFTSSDLSAYRNLWLGISKLKGASITSSAWDSSKRIEIQNVVRIEALKAARDKAVVMATTLGMKVAEPLAIEEPLEFGDDAQSNMLMFAAGQIADGGDPVSPGSIEIRVRVQVSFRIVPE